MSAIQIMIIVVASGAMMLSAPAELITGGTASDTNACQELQLNTKFFWELKGTNAQSVTTWLDKEMAAYKTVGVKYFWAYAVAPAEAAVFSDYVESANKYKALETGYSWEGPLGKRWMELVTEKAAWKLPLVYNFIPDEIYYNNAHIPYAFGVPVHPKTPWYPATPEEKAAFSNACALSFPPVTSSRFLGGDTRQNRAYILYRYQSLARTIKSWYAAARAVNPEIQTTAVINLTPVYGLERYPGGMALDLIGEDAGLTYVAATAFQCSYDWRGPDTHYYPAETVKHLLAGFPKAKVIAFPSAKVWEPDSRTLGPILAVEEFPKLRPVDILGIAVSCIGQGAGGYLPFAAGNKSGLRLTPELWEAQRRTYALLHDISLWVEGSQVPGQIVLLYSRAGEDWYSLAHEDKPDAMSDGSMAMRERSACIQMTSYLSYHLGKDQERTRGFRAHKNMLHFLLKNALPFRMHYLDTLKPEQIAEAKVIVLPFAHSISKEASTLLHKTVVDGKKILLYDMLGERDPEGQRYPTPLLADLVGHTNVNYFDGGTLMNVADPSVAVPMRQMILQMLGEHAPLTVEPDFKAEVEVTVRAKSENDKTIFIVNWSSVSAKIKVGVPLPRGEYQVVMYDVDKPSPLGNTALHPEKDLLSLLVEVGPLSALVMHVTAVK